VKKQLQKSAPLLHITPQTAKVKKKEHL